MKLLTVLLILWPTLNSEPAQKPKPEISNVAVEARILALINGERGLTKVGLLQLDEKLSDVARKHSEDMAARNYFKSTKPDGKGPRARLQAAGYACDSRMGENIFLSRLYSGVETRGKRTVYDWNSLEDIATGTVQAWMNSDDHRDNILHIDYDRTGIGVAIGADDKVYITEMFCR
jgi:uncharacterized protein YkwD